MTLLITAWREPTPEAADALIDAVEDGCGRAAWVLLAVAYALALSPLAGRF